MVSFALSIYRNDVICTNVFEIKKTFDISYNYISKAVLQSRIFSGFIVCKKGLFAIIEYYRYTQSPLAYMQILACQI